MKLTKDSIHILTFLIFLISFISCNSGDNLPVEIAQLTGIIYMNETPLEKNQTITIRIDNKNYNSAIINNNGSFTVKTSILLINKIYKVTIKKGNYSKNIDAIFYLDNFSFNLGNIYLGMDITPPDAPLISGISAGIFNTSQTFELTGESNATYEYSLDDGITWLTYAVPVSLISDGTYNVRTRQIDEAGNISPATDCITIIIDTTLPDAPAISGINSGSYNVNQSFTISGVEDIIEYSLNDGSTWITYTGEVTLSSEDAYEIVVRQEDEAGNYSELESAIIVTIDKSTPAAPVISGITNGEYIVGKTFTVTGESNTLIEYSLNNGTSWTTYTGEVTLNDVGDFIITARQSDDAGNESPLATAISVTMKPYLVSIEIWQDNPPVVMTQTQQFLAKANYSDSTTVDITSEATWSSSSEPVATINSNGLLTIVSTGTTTISADFDGKSDSESYPVVLRYNHIRQKSVHNTYERNEAIQDVLIYHRVRSIEYDLWTYKSGYSDVNQNWFIYHTPVVSHGTSVHMLSDGLDELKAFHEAVPDHEVVTIWMDIKDDWESNRNPSDLDARLEMELGADLIFKPSDMMARASGAANLKEVIDTVKWPALSELKGKFIFVLTDATDRLVEYVDNGSNAATRYAFVAPGISSSSQIDDYNFQIFFNMNNSEVSCASDVYSNGYISRAYYVDSESKNNTARSYKVHHIAADQTNFHEDSWTITHNSNGWPFDLISFTLNDYNNFEESANIIGVIVDSGDIWGNYDDFAMYYNDIGNTSTDRNYTAFVSTPNSHVEDWPKGCLMARNTFSGDNTGEGSAYFAVCRPADNNKIRVQYRKRWTNDTEAVETDIVPSNTIDQESIIHMKLEIYNNSTCARGYASQDGENWVLIRNECGFPVLRYDGLAASSHDNSTDVKFLFGNLTYTDSGGSEIYSRSDLSGFAGIGNGYYSSSIFDGIFQ